MSLDLLQLFLSLPEIGLVLTQRPSASKWRFLLAAEAHRTLLLRRRDPVSSFSAFNLDLKKQRTWAAMSISEDGHMVLDLVWVNGIIFPARDFSQWIGGVT